MFGKKSSSIKASSTVEFVVAMTLIAIAFTIATRIFINNLGSGEQVVEKMDETQFLFRCLHRMRVDSSLYSSKDKYLFLKVEKTELNKENSIKLIKQDMIRYQYTWYEDK